MALETPHGQALPVQTGHLAHRQLHKGKWDPQASCTCWPQRCAVLSQFPTLGRPPRFPAFSPSRLFPISSVLLSVSLGG